MGAGWDTAGDKEKPVHEQETVGLLTWGREGRREDQTTCTSKSEVQPLRSMRVYTCQTNEKERSILCVSVKKNNTRNAFKPAYLREWVFFFLMSARQGVTITEICESG